ncbi:hypothetical protein L2Y94_00195 [Luteibacter aegosomatis]|uniref:hypothetical protein n=1 Tax=Luteibacter aegosomatis TaxID=2911537 RepID=UPI001FF834A7|nr:hypothetical protein [Luteibacter aegosomatis]UPG85818.1 hypothetical protein L2Y94_00195 [Luteibacter aegosomatis]
MISKSSRVHAVLAVAVALGPAGCASSSRAVRPADAVSVPAARLLTDSMSHADTERRVPVTVVRDKGSVGAFVHTVLLIDRVPVVALDRREKVDLYLSPGRHIFTVSYMKHLHGRPLGEYAYEVEEGGNNEFRLRLVLKDAPRIERYGAPEITTPSGKPAWHDRENLEEYAEPSQIATIVDDAIANASTADWWKTLSGRGMNEKTRYVYTAKGGWVDLKHVISTASNPGCYIPGASVFGAWSMEVMQVFYAPFSAFEPEDFLSNRIGGHAAVRFAATLGRAGTRGQIVQRAIERLEPLTQAEAARHFRVSMPLNVWPFDPDEVAPIASEGVL